MEEGNEDETTHFYNDQEYWSPPTNCYPTWDDACRYVSSRTCHSATPRLQVNDAAYRWAQFVHDIWTAGDGCPLTVGRISSIYTQNVKPVFKSYKYGSLSIKRSHKKTASDEKKLPQRKSSRIKSPVQQQALQEQTPQQQEQQQQQRTPLQQQEQNTPQQQQEQQTELQQIQQVQVQNDEPVHSTPSTSKNDKSTSEEKHTKSNRKATRRCLNAENPRYVKWMNEKGKLLFDVFSIEQMIKTRKSGHVFDSEFYEDQKDINSRKMIIARMRVRKEWHEQEKKLERRKALQYARQLSQRQEITKANKEEIEKFLDDEPDLSTPEQSPFKSPLAVPHPSISETKVVSHIETRSSEKVKRNIDFKVHQSCQTDEAYLPVSTRASSKSTLCKPSYLQAGLLMMAVGNQSATQAVLNMFIMDTEVYKQTRSLPLKLQKKYQQKLKTLKKLKAVRSDEAEVRTNNTSEIPEDESVISELNIEITEDGTGEENDAPIDYEEEDSIIVTAEILQPSEDKGDDHAMESVEKYIKNMKEYHHKNLSNILPDPRTIREAHRVASTYLEGKVGQEMLKSGTSYIMPDGTSRAKVGKMGASIVHVGDKMRALKMQKMGSDKQENWVDTIIHQLNRLATAGDISINEIYETIKGIISDACSVNKGLAVALSAQLGVTWIPGQLYCCIHTVLGFQTGMVKLWLKYQSLVGYEKMYPEITGLELDMEDKCLVKQILECFLRLTADRWQARSWNKFEEFDQFCKDNNTTNLSQQLHGQRFGELEKCCGIGIYLLDIWHKFINTFSNVRNQLAIFLRDTSHLIDICNFLWLGPALIGIHLTEPYLLLLLEKKVTHLDLLVILPQLHKELKEYPCSLVQINQPAFESLAKGWIHPSSPQAPYNPEIGKGIAKAIEKCEIELLDSYCKELCSAMGDILERQRGAAYGFGKDKDSPELVTKQFTKEQLGIALTHSKPIENLFGVSGSILDRFGGQAFDKATDDLIIRYSQDHLSDPSDWCSTKMRKKKRELQELQSTFNEKQDALLKAGVTKTDAILLNEENKIQRVVQQCRKSHNGPITNAEELENICLKYAEDAKSLRSALVYEIRYRKFSVKNIKEDNPLFKQVNLTVDVLKENLKLLLTKTDRTMASTVTMEDLQEVIGSSDQWTEEEEGENPIEETNVESHRLGQLGETERCIDDTGEIGGDNSNNSETNESVPEKWPPKIGEHIAANFDDGFHIGEVISIIDNDTVNVSYMKPKKVLTASADEHPRKFWIWPYPEQKYPTNRHCILDLRPAELTLAVPPSTKRMLVFSVGNAEILARLWSEAETTI